MAVTAEAVKTLRERTGAGMMECKKALQESNGDLDAAAELMRKTGLAKADKKVGRIAAEGVVVIDRSADGKLAAIVEINCETDFVAREADFQAFAAKIGKLALAHRATDVAAIASLPLDGSTVEEVRRALIAKIGEKIDIRRVAILEAPAAVGTYLHGTRIGALVGLKSGSEAVAKDIAMHVAAINPAQLSSADVPDSEIAKERSIFEQQTRTEGKPEAMVPKIVEGRVRKWLSEITLLGQPFVKDDKLSVEKFLKQSNAEVSRYIRFEVGAGIEKKQEDFAAEVMKQVRGG